MKIDNKNARFYKILEKLETGIVLIGSEVKAVKDGHVDLSSSFVKIIDSQAFLINAKIYPYQSNRIDNYDESRMRKLLLHKREIIAISSRIKQGNFTLIPLSLYTKNNLIKLQIALVQGRKKYEKRQILKMKDLQREQKTEIGGDGGA